LPRNPLEVGSPSFVSASSSRTSRLTRTVRRERRILGGENQPTSLAARKGRPGSPGGLQETYRGSTTAIQFLDVAVVHGLAVLGDQLVQIRDYRGDSSIHEGTPFVSGGTFAGAWPVFVSLTSHLL